MRRSERRAVAWRTTGGEEFRRSWLHRRSADLLNSSLRCAEPALSVAEGFRMTPFHK